MAVTACFTTDRMISLLQMVLSHSNTPAIVCVACLVASGAQGLICAFLLYSSDVVDTVRCLPVPVTLLPSMLATACMPGAECVAVQWMECSEARAAVPSLRRSCGVCRLSGAAQHRWDRLHGDDVDLGCILGQSPQPIIAFTVIQ